jgi:hypothetical protein
VAGGSAQERVAEPGAARDRAESAGATGVRVLTPPSTTHQRDGWLRRGTPRLSLPLITHPTPGDPRRPGLPSLEFCSDAWSCLVARTGRPQRGSQQSDHGKPAWWPARTRNRSAGARRSRRSPALAVRTGSDGRGDGRGLQAVQSFVEGANEAGAVLDTAHGAALQRRGQPAHVFPGPEVERGDGVLVADVVGDRLGDDPRAAHHHTAGHHLLNERHPLRPERRSVPGVV